MLFIGNFVFASGQEKVTEEERRHGEFSLIIEARDPNEAVKKFRFLRSKGIFPHPLSYWGDESPQTPLGFL